MRTLKKTLCLVLAIVMVLGLGAFSVNAAVSDYTDRTSITYKEAVDVLSAVGVLDGKTDTEYKPTDTLTRAEGAAIVTRAMGILNPVGKSTFSDTQGHWAEAYIAYVEANGIADGTDDVKNTFEPEAALTGSAFAKWLLVALGYDPVVEGLTGAQWEIGVAKLIPVAGLNVGMGGFDQTRDVKREEAAQLGFNALKADMVYYSNQMSVRGENVSVVTAGNRQPYTNDKTLDYRYPTGTANVNVQLVEQSFPNLKLVKSTDDYGDPANKWVDSGKTIATYARTPAFVYTTGMNSDSGKSTLASDLANYSWSANIDRKNGESTYTGSGITASSINKTTGISDIAAKTGNGRVVELYTDSTTVTDVVIKDYDLYKVTNKTGSAVYLTKQSVGTFNTNSLTVTASNDNKDFYSELSALAVDDYAYLATNGTGGKIVGTETFSTTTGECTSISSNNKYTVDGTAYSKAANGKAPEVGTSYNVWLDKYDNIVFVKSATDTSKSIAFVLGYDVEGGVVGGYTAVARLLTTEGKAVNVKVKEYTPAAGSTVNMNRGDNAYTYFHTGGTFNSEDGKFIQYTENTDGTYNLFGTGDQDDTITHIDGTGVSTTLTASDKAYSFDSQTSYKTLNSATKFVVQTSANTYNAYTGIKNIPDITIADASKVYVKYTNNIANAVYVLENTGSYAKIAGTGVNYLVFYTSKHGTTQNEDGDTVYTYDVLKDGVNDTVKTTITTWHEDDGHSSHTYDVGDNAWYFGVYLNPIYDSDGYLVSATPLYTSISSTYQAFDGTHAAGTTAYFPNGAIYYVVSSGDANCYATINGDSGDLTVKYSAGKGLPYVGSGMDGSALSSGNKTGNYTVNTSNFVAYKVTTTGGNEKLEYQNLIGSTAQFDDANYIFTCNESGEITGMYFFVA